MPSKHLYKQDFCWVFLIIGIFISVFEDISCHFILRLLQPRMIISLSVYIRGLILCEDSVPALVRLRHGCGNIVVIME